MKSLKIPDKNEQIFAEIKVAEKLFRLLLPQNENT